MAGTLQKAKADASLDFKTTSAANSPPKIMDFRPASGLASGMKRVGGRGGVSRLGRSARKGIGEARRGRPVILHKY